MILSLVVWAFFGLILVAWEMTRINGGLFHRKNRGGAKNVVFLTMARKKSPAVKLGRGRYIILS
ncbi:hypothetical protein IKF15_04120 [Candidatus Saccharibacteria bacterium]|nr:hypothetical protein [Candidatus Saccharibacteria bacterium]